MDNRRFLKQFTDIDAELERLRYIAIVASDLNNALNASVKHNRHTDDVKVQHERLKQALFSS